MKVEVIEDGNTVIRRSGGFDIVFERNGPINEVFMNFGMSIPESIGSLKSDDTYFAMIPLQTARKLFSQYPDMNKCTGEGSNEAKAAVQNMNMIFPEIKTYAHKKMPKIYENIKMLRAIVYALN